MKVNKNKTHKLKIFFLQFFILSSGYIENKMLMVINISNHDNIKTTSNANGLQIAITTHNYLQISNRIKRMKG